LKEDLTKTREQQSHARLEVLTAGLLKIRVFWKFPASNLTVPGQTMRTVAEEVALRFFSDYFGLPVYNAPN
jgi:hypothetical protein